MEYKLLVVDDDDEDFMLLATRFNECRHKVNLVHISDTEELIQFIETGVLPDLVIVDARMPLIDGYELVTRLRNSSVWRRVPIIVWTGSVSDEENVRLYEAGANSVILKQDTLEQVQAFCQYWFGLVRLPTVVHD